MLIFNIIIIATSWTIVSLPASFFYFGLGSMFIASLFALTDLGKTFGDRNNFLILSKYIQYLPKIDFSLISTYGRKKYNILDIELHPTEKKVQFKIGGFIAYLSISMIIFACFSRFPVFDISQNLRTINSFPYRIYNLYEEDKNKKTIIRDVINGDLGSYKEVMNFEDYEIVKFRASLRNFILQKATKNLPIFLSKKIGRLLNHLYLICLIR